MEHPRQEYCSECQKPIYGAAMGLALRDNHVTERFCATCWPKEISSKKRAAAEVNRLNDENEKLKSARRADRDVAKECEREITALRAKLAEAVNVLRPFAWDLTWSTNSDDLFSARVMDGNRAAAVLAEIAADYEKEKS